MHVDGFSRWARKVERPRRRWLPFLIAVIALTAAALSAVAW